VLDRKSAKDTVEDVIRFREINQLLAKMGEYSKLPPSRLKEYSDLYTERETLVRKMQKEDPAKDAKSRMTPAQKKALEAYKFAEAQEDRYLGSVFVNSVGQRRVEEKTRAAYEECKRLGMGIEHGLDAVAEAQKVNGGFRV
jgi:cell division protein FtsN